MVLIPHVQTAAGPTHKAATSQRDYTITLDDGTTTTIKFEDLIKVASRVNPASTSIPEAFEGLSHFLRLGSKITMDHAGICHKGFLAYTKEGGHTLMLDTTLDQQRSIGQFHYHNLSRIGLTWWVRMLLSPAISQSVHS